MLITVHVVTVNQHHIKEAQRLKKLDEDIDIEPTKVDEREAVIDLRDIDDIVQTIYEDVNEFDLPVDKDGVLINKKNGRRYVVSDDFEELKSKMFQLQEKEERDRKEYLEAIRKLPLKNNLN